MKSDTFYRNQAVSQYHDEGRIEVDDDAFPEGSPAHEAGLEVARRLGWL